MLDDDICNQKHRLFLHALPVYLRSRRFEAQWMLFLKGLIKRSRNILLVCIYSGTTPCIMWTFWEICYMDTWNTNCCVYCKQRINLVDGMKL